MPIFLNPRDLATLWEKSGRDKDALPEDVTVLELRMLVQQMQTDSNPWSIFHFVASPEAVKLATDLQGGGDGADGEGEDAAESKAEEEEEEEEIVV